MTCPHCGAPNVPDNASTCPWCGRAVTLSGSEPLATAERERPVARPAASPEPARKPYLLAGILGAVILILIVALIVATRPDKAVTQAPTAAPPAPGPPVTTAPAVQPPVPGPPITQAPVAQAPAVKLPQADPNKAAVQAYLQRVGAIERQRQAVVNNLVPALLEAQILQAGLGETGMMKELLDPNPDAFAKAKDEAAQAKPSDVQNLITGYVGQLRTLDTQLRAIQPVPYPAYDFARAYDNAFSAYAGSMVQIGQLMNQGLQNQDQAASVAGQISGMKGQFQNQAQQGLVNADAQLTTLCQKYGIPKPFDITDNPTGTVTGL